MINNQNNRRVASVTRLRMVIESDSFIIRIRRSFKMRIQFFKRIDNCKVLW